jgi:hypothetical protein
VSELRYPSLHQINTRVWLTELSHTPGKIATLDDIPDAGLDRLAELGFDWVCALCGRRMPEARTHLRRHHYHSGPAEGRQIVPCHRDCPALAPPVLKRRRLRSRRWAKALG